MASASTSIPNQPPPENDPFDARYNAVEYLISDRVADANRSAVANLWYFINNPTEITKEQDWPFKNIFSHQATFVPNVHPDVSPIPPQICAFLAKDLRLLTVDQRLDHASLTMLSREIKKFDMFWINILLAVLIAYTNCELPRTRSEFAKRATVLSNIYSEASEEVPSVTNLRMGYQHRNEDNSSSPSKYDARSVSSLDLNKSIQVMMQVFPMSERISGSETEAFTGKLNPILEQINASKIPDEHQPTVLFSLTQPSSKARSVLKKCNLQNISIDNMVDHLKEECLYDPNIQDRRANRWNSVTYKEFQAKFSSEDEATRACIEHITLFHKDLPKHLNNDAQLRDRLRNIFKGISWCSTLFEKPISQYSPSSFGSMIITAAANADDRSRNRRNGNEAQPAVHHLFEDQSPNTYNDLFQKQFSSLIAFFAKTPPPHRSRRPFQFQRRQNYINNRTYGNNPGLRTNRRPYFPSSNMNNRQCYSCRRYGHIMRNCPQKRKYVDKLANFVNLGEASKMIVNSLESEASSTDMEELCHFIEESEAAIMEDSQDYPEFNNWLCLFLNQLDEIDDNENFHIVSEPMQYDACNASNIIAKNETSNQENRDAFYLKMSISQLANIKSEITDSVCHMEQISKFMLIDTGAPKSICSEDWLEQANWTPVQVIQVPTNTKPFRFAGQPVHPKYIACLLSKVRDINGAEHLFRQVVFILPPLPIPFLTGLQVQRSLGFDLCLREGKGSYIKIQKWNTTLPLHVSSHLWLEFQPLTVDEDRSYDWNPLIKQTIARSNSENNLVLPVKWDQKNNFEDENADKYYPMPPWQKDEWTSNLNEKDISKLHQTLRHPEPTALLRLFRQQRLERRLPHALKKKITDHNCQDCEEHAQLPRVPRISIPPPATPNIAVTLDVMQHEINNRTIKILVILDAGDMMIRLKEIRNESAKEAFLAYFCRWISIFDSPIFTIVDRGRNLTNDYMSEQLRLVNSQLCPIPTEAPWSIGNNERSHGFIHRVLDKLQSNSAVNASSEVEICLAEAEMAWNFVQHTRNTIPHYNRFGVMPRQLGETESCPSVRNRIALMELAREHTDQARAEHVILRALNRKYRHVTDLKLFRINDKVWFHRNKFGWRLGEVVKVVRPTIHVEHNNRIYPTHESRVRPFFGDQSQPPELNLDSPDSHGSIDKPTTVEDTETNADTQEQNEEQQISRRPTAISDLVNGTFIVMNPVKDESNSTILTEDNMILMNVGKSPRGIVDSTVIYHTEVEHVKRIDTLDVEKQNKFKEAMREEIDFLLKNTVEVMDEKERDDQCEIQPLKWVLSIKRSPNSEPPVRYRARLVSASNQTELRHSVHGNTPTVAMHTIRIAMSLFPTWSKAAEDMGSKLVFFTRDITKAFLQSIPSKRLIYYQPPPEYFDLTPRSNHVIWKANTQLYGDVEAGLYWNKTFVPWLCNNIVDLQQSIYDPSLLISPSKTAVMLLCTDDTANILMTEDLESESNISKRFVCRERQFAPTDFKGIDITLEGGDIYLSQNEYSTKMVLQDLSSSHYTRQELDRALSTDELKVLRSDAGRLAWLATGTSPASAFQGSVSLQSGRDSPRTVQTMITTRKVLELVRNDRLCILKYTDLNPDSIHIRLYSDGAFQNLKTKHSQIGFIIGIADEDHKMNIVHWHSARSSRRPNSTEESEMFALDAGIKMIRNMRKIVFELVHKQVPVVCYIDNETLWTNLMNITAHSLPEVAYRCREAVYDEILNSICLIKSQDNPADSMTKEKDNGKLKECLKTGFCFTLPTRVFMLQESKYRNCYFIPTSRVPMNAE